MLYCISTNTVCRKWQKNHEIRHPLPFVININNDTHRPLSRFISISTHRHFLQTHIATSSTNKSIHLTPAYYR